jgi:hypothetical protein
MLGFEPNMAFVWFVVDRFVLVQVFPPVLKVFPFHLSICQCSYLCVIRGWFNGQLFHPTATTT